MMRQLCLFGFLVSLQSSSVLAQTSDGGVQNGVPLRAFECTRTVTGKRTEGIQRIRFEPRAESATLTLEFIAGRPECNYAARWRFPQSFFAYESAVPERRRLRSCVGSALSPFAVSCQLFEQKLDSSAYAMRSELRVRASGPSAERSIVFSVLNPSDPIRPAPDVTCDALPVDPPARKNDAARVPHLVPEQFSFSEAACRLLPESDRADKNG